MAMDDWGSPWADEIQKPADTSIQDVELKVERPTTPVAARKTAPLPLSPWGNDGGFEDWAEMPADEHTEGKQLGLGGAGDVWAISNTGKDRGLGDGDLHGLNWNDTTTAHGTNITDLSPSLLPKPFEAARQPSPDPWATETRGQSSIKLESPVENEFQHQDGGLEKTMVFGLEDDILGDLSLPKADLLSSTEPNEITKDGSSIGREIADTIEAKGNDKHTTPHKEAAGKTEGSLENIPTAQEVNHESSRPSSPSENSHQEYTNLESPRTSMDDEPKRPHIPRQVSSKILELVGHFDGLAKAELIDDIAPAGEKTSLEEGEVQTREPTKPESEFVEDGEEEEEDDDFGDFEEGQSEQDRDETKDMPLPVMKSPMPPVPVQMLPPRPALKRDFGHIEFTTDATPLEKLFACPKEETSEKVYVPDIVPNDSFTTVEERKTWYRISRYGTMLKHNTGEESYVRVNWAKSQVRIDTLKIVARWMEEDRISGRVVLGGGSKGKGTSVFGWNDSNNTNPVSLAAAFASKNKKRTSAQGQIFVEPDVPREWQGLVRSRSASKSRSSSKTRSSPSKPPRRNSTKSSKSSIEAKHEPEPPIATFVWSEAKPKSSSQATIPAAPQVAPAPSNFASPPRTMPSRQSLPPNITVPVHPKGHKKSPRLNGLSILSPIMGTPTAVIPPAAPNPVIDDDDEWGEMVSTPITPAAPVLPASTKSVSPRGGSQHLSGKFPLPLQHFPAIISQPLPAPFTSGPLSDTFFGDTSVTNTGVLTSSKSEPLSLAFDSFDTSNTDPNINPSTNDFYQSSESTATPIVSSTPDPWASADFSFFDSGPTPPAKPAPAPIPKASPERPPARNISPQLPPANTSGPIPKTAPQKPIKISPFLQQQPPPYTSSSIPKSASLRSVASSSQGPPFRNTPTPTSRPTPLKSVAFAAQPHPASWGHGRTQHQVEEDEIVAGIVKELPDLSYMLR